MKHIEESDIEAFAAGHTGFFSRLLCSWHFRRCPECAQRLEKARKGWGVVEDLKKAIESADECAPSQAEEETATATLGEALAPQSRGSEDGGK